MRNALTAVFLLLILQLACTSHQQIKELLHADTPGWAHDVDIEWDRLYVSDRDAGFVVFDRAWRVIQSATPVKDVISLAPNSGMPVLASRFQGLVLSSPSGQIHDSYSFSDGDIANAVQVRGDLLYAAYGMHGLVIARLRQNHIQPVSCLPTPGWSHDLRLSQNQALVADWNRGLRVVDIRIPEKPVEIAFSPTMATSISMAIQESGDKRIVAVAEGNAGVSLISLDSDGRPSLLSRNFLGLNPANPIHPESGGWVHSVAWAGRYLVAANWKRGLAVLDASDYLKPKLVLEVSIRGTALGVKTQRQPDGSYLIFLADGESGLRIFSLKPS